MKRLHVPVVALALSALLFPAATPASETRVLEVRARPADTGERTYYIGAGATVEEAVVFRDALIAAGAWNVNLFVQDRVIVCSMPPGVAAAVPVPAAFSREPADPAQAPASAVAQPWGWIADAYALADRAPSGVAGNDEGAVAEPLDDVVLTVSPERVREIQREVERSMALEGNAPRPEPARNMNQNSELLTGSILANFIFPESDGSDDPSVENWSADDMREARIGASGAFLAWQAWTQMDINTTFNLVEAVPTRYEPITHDMSSDELWINDVMRNLGWGQQINNSLGIVHEFNEYQRSVYRTRWVVTGFIACARNTPGHRFGGGGANYTAYAYLGGPYMIEPFPAGSDPNGIGETLVFSKIVQHEMGHNFWTLDEYPGAPGDCHDTSGYLNYANMNISMSGPGGEVRCENLTPCIMHTAPRVGQDRPWCRYSLGHLGVIDDNNNGYPDLFEAAPDVIFEPAGPETVSTNQFTLRFRVVSRAVPNRNRAQDPATRVDYAAPVGEVKFSLGATSGISLVPIDGHLDEVVEEFEVPITLASVGQSAVVIRARNSVGYQSPAYAKIIYFTGVNYTHIGATVQPNRIDVSWETAGDVFGSQFDVYRLEANEPPPGTRIAQKVPPAGPGTAGFVPYRYVDWDVTPGSNYGYYVVGSFTLPFEGGTQTYNSPSGIVGQTAAIPSVDGEFVSGIAPNPSNGHVTFSISVPRTYDSNPRTPQRLATPVTVEVFDVRGRRVRVLADEPEFQDFITLRWDGRSEASTLLPAGVYFVRVRAGEAEMVRKLVLVR